jgi:hypothetical protein
MNNRLNRCRKNHKTQVNFLRCFVNHYSFVTGLTGALNGLSGGPEDCSIGVNTVLNANIYEGYKVRDPMMFGALEEAPYHNVLEGSLFQCCDLLAWIGNTSDSKGLKECQFSKSPTEFTIEHWFAKEDDEYTWQLKHKTIWEGVKWLDAAHTGDGGDRACAGIATFVCEKKTTVDVEDGEVITIPNNLQYPAGQLRQILKENSPEPKHLKGYLG